MKNVRVLLIMLITMYRE